MKNQSEPRKGGRWSVKIPEIEGSVVFTAEGCVLHDVIHCMIFVAVNYA